MDSQIDKSSSTSSWDGIPLGSLYRVPAEDVADQEPPLSPSADQDYLLSPSLDQEPPLSPSAHHTVCIALPLPSTGCPLPNPPQLEDIWDSSHVRMPWSNHNLYPIPGHKSHCLRWELIQNALSRRKMKTSKDIEVAIIEYNKKYRGKPGWSFQGLHSLFDSILPTDYANTLLEETLPSMVKLLMESPQMMTSPIPLLTRGMHASVTLSQQQIGALLVNAFFCTFPWRNAGGRNTEYSTFPTINFNRLFDLSSRRPQAMAQKLKCHLNYFQLVVTNPPTGVVTFTRQSAPTPSWETSTRLLPRLHITSTGNIEDSAGLLQVDFAAAKVGGGVLDEGMVQEEIRFTVSPELIVARLFTERLADNEVLIISGVQRFSYYSGYKNTFKFTGPYCDETSVDSSGRRYTSIVAMDALHFSNKKDQYRINNVDRELAKAYVGFTSNNAKEGDKLAAVATGNWGCGAFGGDPRFKAMIQLMAAAEAGRDVVYFTFGDDKLRKDVFHLYTFLVNNSVEVGRLYKAICRFCKTGKMEKGVDFYAYLYQVLY